MAVMLVVVGGCAGRESLPALPTQNPPPFSQSGELPVSDRWWSEFADPALNEQINQALESSFTLAAARQRLRAARAVARREASDLFPDVNGVADIGGSFGPGTDLQNYVFGFEAAYPLDLWGQIESRVEAERLRAAATQQDYRAVALTLSAEITRTWFSLIEAHAQLGLLDEQIKTNRTGLLLQESRFGLGLIRSPDVLRQRQLVEATLEQAVVAKARIEVLEHQLAVLVGQMPQSAQYDAGTVLPDLPPLPATGLPSELLQRRPDVRRDYLAFAAADRDLAAAISDQYPRLSLTGSLLNVADRPETIFRDWFVSIGGQLIAPLVDGGQRKAEVARTSAVVCELFNRYGQTMLIAFGEVEDSLARERYQIERLSHLEKQLELARQAAEQLREQYLLEPDTDYLAVLTAITAQQRLQREMLSAQLELRLIRVALYLALAGSFDPLPQDNLQPAPTVQPPASVPADMPPADIPTVAISATDISTADIPAASVVAGQKNASEALNFHGNDIDSKYIDLHYFDHTSAAQAMDGLIDVVPNFVDSDLKSPETRRDE
ncbi:TolC family protein [Novipirellula caenicola]